MSGRIARWTWRHPEHGYGVLEIVEEGKAASYFVLVDKEPRTWILSRLEPGVGIAREYTVGLAPVPHCQCDGFRYRNTCRHVEALQALSAAGKL